jgi:Tfp pilus assembly protein PilO
MLSNLRGSWRTPVHLALAGAVAMTMTVHAWWIQPKRRALHAQADALESTRRELMTARRAAARVSSVEPVATSLDRQRAVLQSAAGSEREATELLRDVQTLGDGPDLRVIAFKPAAPVRRDALIEWSVVVELEGSYAGLLQFLRDVAEYPRLVVVSALRVRPAESDRAAVSLTASCRLSTFGPASAATDAADRPWTPPSPPGTGRPREDSPR